MRLRVLMLSVVGTTGAAAAAFGQTAAVPRQAADRQGPAQSERRAADQPAPTAEQQPQQAAQAPTRAAASDLLHQNGNSLLKASLAANPDKSRARLKDISYTSVPVPE